MPDKKKNIDELIAASSLGNAAPDGSDIDDKELDVALAELAKIPRKLGVEVKETLLLSTTLSDTDRRAITAMMLRHEVEVSRLKVELEEHKRHFETVAKMLGEQYMHNKVLKEALLPFAARAMFYVEARASNRLQEPKTGPVRLRVKHLRDAEKALAWKYKPGKKT